MKCPKCGAENPDYGYYCGSCASELRVGNQAEAGKGDPRKVEPQTKIESILRRNIVRVGENAAKKKHGLFGRFGGTFWRSGTIVFKSEFEEVSLSFDGEGHPSVSKGISKKHGLMLEGPHDSFLTMFRDEHHVDSVPDSIEIHAEGLEPFQDEVAQQILRGTVNKLLRIMFE